MPNSKYAWPASGLSPAEMSLLFQARQAAPRRITIQDLIAEAVRTVYGKQAQKIQPQPDREAA